MLHKAGQLLIAFLLINFSLIAQQEFLEGRISKKNIRYKTFKKALKLMEKRGCRTIIETGTARNGKDDFADGGSTIIFADWSSKNDALLYSVDIDAQNLENAQMAVTEYMPNVILVQSDSVEFLKNFQEQIDFLYLDSFDLDPKNPKPSQKHHLNEIKAAYSKLSPNCVVMIDDCNYSLTGKGKYVIKFLLKRNWKIVANKYQVILTR